MIRVRYLEANIWELFLALLVAITMANYFASPPPGGVTTPEAYWEVLYGTGGCVIIAGLLWLSVRVRVAGLSLFAGGALVNALQAIHIAGWDAWLQVLILALFALAALIKIKTILRVTR